MAGNILTSPEDVINAALGRIGYKRRVGSIWEGSDAAKLALDIYGQTRDQLLRAKIWDFAQNEVMLTPVVGAQPFPWLFLYAYPQDCIRIRELIGPAYQADTNDPLPNRYQRESLPINGVLTDVILCNVSPAQLVYTGRIASPLLWDTGFAETLIDALGRRLSPSLASLDVEKIAEATETATIGAMAEIVG